MMSEDGGPPPKRCRIYKDEVDQLTKEELIQKLLEQDIYIDTLQNKTDGENATGEDVRLDTDDKLKQQQVDATRRENVLVMRLTTKEQEMQEYLNQIQELKQTKNPGTTQLRGMLLDPAINLMFQRMRKEMDSCREKLEQAQNDLAAWKFTPDSQTGKRLMAKCRMLLQENEELGKMISAGRTAKLEGEIALKIKFVEEMKKTQAETDEFLGEMDEDLEGMQSTILFLQRQLKESKEELSQVREENIQLRQQQQQLQQQQLQQQQMQQQQQQQALAFPDRDRDSSIAQRASDSSGVHNRGSPTRDRDSAGTQPHSQPHSQHVDMDTEGEYQNVEQTPIRTTNMAVPMMNAKPSHNYSGNRTSNDDNVVSSSSLDGAVRAAYLDQEESEPHSTHESRHSPPSASNGDHVVAMETDICEEPQSSCDDNTLRHRQSDCQVAALPQPSSPHTQCNHAPCRTSHSSDGTCPEVTDASSEAWSPSNQSKTSGMVSEEDHREADKYRTDAKAGLDRLQNGLLSKQYDVPELKTEITN